MEKQKKEQEMKLKQIEKDLKSEQGLEGRLSSMSIDKTDVPVDQTPQISLFNQDEESDEDDAHKQDDDSDGQEKLELESFKRFLESQTNNKK